MLKRKYTIVAVFVVVFALYTITNFSSDNRVFYINDMENKLIDKVKPYISFNLEDYVLVHMSTLADDIRYVYREDEGIRKEVEDLYYNMDNVRTSDTLIFFHRNTKQVKMIYISSDFLYEISSTYVKDEWIKDEMVYELTDEDKE